METSYLERVRKLLVKAERAATEAEASAYSEMAEKLIVRHGVDTALLAEADQVTDLITQKAIAMDAPYADAKARLLYRIARALGASAIMHHHPKRPSLIMAVTVVGFGSDIGRVELLYTSLLLQATSQVTRVRPPSPVRGQTLAGYRRAWLYGFADRVGDRLTEAQARAAGEADADRRSGEPGAELVLAGRRDQVERAFSAAFPNARPGRKRQLLDGAGFDAGAAAGARANLGTNRSVTNAERPKLH